MSTLSDLKGLQAAYDLKEALTQTDDRLFGSQKAEGATGGRGGGGWIGDSKMLPIVTPNGRSFLRDAAKGMRLEIDRDTVKPGNVLEYKSESGETRYAQVSSVGEFGIGEEGITVKEMDADSATQLLQDHPDKRVTLSEKDMRREPVYKRAPKDFWDIIFSPLDWLVVKTHNSPLSRAFGTLGNKRNKEVFIVIGVIVVLAYMAFTFYLVVR